MKLWTKGLQVLREERGAYLVLIAAILPLIFGFVGLAVDLGNYHAHSAKLQHAADAATLAGAAIYSAEGETESSHPYADEAAEKYLKANLGVDEYNALVKTGDEIRYQVKTSDGVSYFRVYIRESLDTSFIRLLGAPFFTHPQGEAIATIPTRQDTEQLLFDSLFSFDGKMDGTFNSNNGDDLKNRSAKIQSTFDGNIYCFNSGNFQKYIYNPYYNKIYTGDARNLTRQEANNKSLYTSIQERSQSDFTDFTNKANNALKAFFDTDITVVKIYNQSSFLPVGYSSSDYYCLQAGGNSNLNLKLSNFSGDQNKPVYIYVDEKIRGTFNVELQNDIVRPIILCHTENTKIAFNNHGHDFRGVIYAPFADLNSFDFDQGTFIGTIFTHDLKLQSKQGKFVFEQFGLSTSDICGTSGLPVELKLVTDPGLSWNLVP